ncbi:MAG: hydrogenase maturation nickel metallochaperone HypA [Christensenellaceae bacterium]|jgi:hydrogenase nickel incorporation protein HypA/HybF|nr:hydrogenase maturation nickel metallochaperone HypA [Christensenellaceae bacterium]
MHEMSLLVYVVDEVEKVAKENNAKKVETITLEYGEVSGILADCMVDFWELISKRSELLKDSKLILEMLPAVTVCNDCGKRYPTVEFAKVCPSCKSKNTELLCGSEFNIKEIAIA